MLEPSEMVRKVLNDSTNESLVFDETNLHGLSFINMMDFDRLFHTLTHWTRITVIEGAKYDKDTVLKSILTKCFMECAPTTVFPALYQNEGNNSFFLIRNCVNIIKRLLFLKLKIPSTTEKVIYKLSITTNYLAFSIEPLDIDLQIKTALIKRGIPENYTYDLTNFSKDECLEDVYVDLSIPTHLNCIFDHMKKCVPIFNIRTLVLQHNNMLTLDNIDLNKFKNLRELDLRFNNITWDGFQMINLKRNNVNGIKSIWLNGNPLCINLPESEFIRRVEAILPSIKKIDGVAISNFFVNYSGIRNFIFDGSWAPFIDHFLHHYFGLMEGPNRHQLARMYHQKATLTISTSQDSDDRTSWNRLINYSSHARNLLTLSDLTKAYSSLKTGPDEIITVLNSLPVMQFDPNSFTVDVPLSQVNGLVMIDVGGNFQELDSGLFYFHRSFLLTPYKKNPGEWKIENDMFTISPATPYQIMKCFSKVRGLPSEEIQSLLNYNAKDKDTLVPTICELTKLTKEYATRFLQEGSWDLERALQAFIDQLKSNQIPMHAFSI